MFGLFVMKKFVIISVAVFVFLAFVVSSALGYNLFGESHKAFFDSFNFGLTGFSKVFSFFIIFILVIFSIMVIISSIVYFFTNENSHSFDNPRE